MAIEVIRGGRGIGPGVVVAPRSALVEPWMEVIALADEALASAQRIAIAAAAGSARAVVKEAARLQRRAAASRTEARARVLEADGPERAA